jgi:hypothetical protein
MIAKPRHTKTGHNIGFLTWERSRDLVDLTNMDLDEKNKIISLDRQIVLLTYHQIKKVLTTLSEVKDSSSFELASTYQSLRFLEGDDIPNSVTYLTDSKFDFDTSYKKNFPQ